MFFTSHALTGRSTLSVLSSSSYSSSYALTNSEFRSGLEPELKFGTDIGAVKFLVAFEMEVNDVVQNTSNVSMCPFMV